MENVLGIRSSPFPGAKPPRRVGRVPGRFANPRPAAINTPQSFAIVLRRLPRVEDAPGLISLMMDTSGGAKPPTRIGTLTDAAVRGRLAQFDVHSANEIAAVRKALSTESGQATLYESWPGLNGCLQFWKGFVGSQICSIAWTCEKCGASDRESIGGSVGESFLRRCACGQVSRITLPKYGPWQDANPAR